jgi:hypothetical protein
MMPIFMADARRSVREPPAPVHSVQHPRSTLAVLLLAGLVGLGPTPPTAAQPLVAPSLRAEAGRVFQDLAQLRGLTVSGGPPRLVIRARDERRRFIMGELARRYPPARLDAERRALAAWGLVPPDFDLGGFLTDLVLEQAAAYYDPVGKIMVLANWLPPEEQREALAHELVHALQDRQVPLDGFLAPAAGRSDATLARQALIEGEAVALSFDLALRRQGRTLAAQPDVRALQRAILTSATGPVLTRAPRFLRASLTFPYAHGLGFVHQFLRRHAWPELSRLYADPPRSSAQILEPARYLDQRDDPVAPALADLGPVLGVGARVVLEDEMGSFGLAEVLVLDPEAPRVPGWRGDRYAVWEDGARVDVLLAVSDWETEADAAAFAAAYAVRATQRRGAPDAGSAPDRPVWSRNGRVATFERQGTRVWLVEQAPAGALDAVRRAVEAPRTGRAAPAAILAAERCRPSPLAGSSASPTRTSIVTTRSTTWCQSSPASAR